MCVAYLTEFACGCTITVPWFCESAEKRGVMCAGNTFGDQDVPKKAQQRCANCRKKGKEGKREGKKERKRRRLGGRNKEQARRHRDQYCR